MQENHWERELLREVALSAVAEQRRARRWNIFFRSAFLAYLIVLLLLSPACQFGGHKPVAERHTAVVDVTGEIADGGEASAERIIHGLQAAFAEENVAGVILRINSPGGSPVQAGRVNDEIRRLRQAHPEKPVYAVVGDMCASGAYYIAVAADRIYVDKASLVGSIGVLMNSFGFTEAMDRLGVERRLYTAGENKAFLDPFSPVKPEDEAHIRSMLDEIHQQFIDVVMQGRGDRLKPESEVFSGLVWTGASSIEIGLADELGSSEFVAREVIGAERMVNYSVSDDFISRLADRLGASAGAKIASLLGAEGAVLR